MTIQRGEPSPAVYYGTSALLAVMALAAIWWPEFPAGTDLPTHLFFAQVLWNPDLYAGLMDTHFAPTSQLWVRMVAPLSGFGPAVAGKLGLTALAALTVGGFVAIGRAIGDRRPLGLVFGLAATQSFYSAMGFANFALAGALACFSVAQAIRAWKKPTHARYVALALCMLLVAHAHVIVAGMMGLFIALLATQWDGRWSHRRVVKTGLALTPAALFSIAVAWTARAGYQAAEVAIGLSAQRRPVLQVLNNIGEETFGGFAPFGWVVLVAVAVGLAVRLVVSPSLRRPLGLVFVVFGALYALVPYHGEGWAYAQCRVLLPLVIVPAAFASAGRRSNLVFALAAACTFAHLAATTLEIRAQGAIVADQVAAFDHVPVGPAMDVVLDPGSTHHPDVQPLLHAGLYALFSGGSSPMLPAYSPMIHSVYNVDTEPPPHPPQFLYRSLNCDENPACANARAAFAQRIAVQGLAYQTTIIVGADAEWQTLLAEHGVLPTIAPALFVPVPSTLTVALTAPPEAATRRLIIRAGFPDGIGWLAGSARAPAPVGPTPQPLALGNVPAGPITVEALWEPSAAHPQGQVVARDVIHIAPGTEASVSLNMQQPR